MRRLPIFLVIDISGPGNDWPSFASDCLACLVDKWRRDPQALEVYWVSIILIADPPVQVFPLTEFTEINSSEFLAIFSRRTSSGCLGQALKLTADSIKAQCRRRTATDRGDYPALVLSMVGFARLLEIRYGSSALASTRPGTSSVCCFSDTPFKAIKDFVDDVSQLKPDPEAVAEWFGSNVHRFSIKYEDGVFVEGDFPTNHPRLGGTKLAPDNWAIKSNVQ